MNVQPKILMNINGKTACIPVEFATTKTGTVLVKRGNLRTELPNLTSFIDEVKKALAWEASFDAHEFRSAVDVEVAQQQLSLDNWALLFTHIITSPPYNVVYRGDRVYRVNIIYIIY